jgi:hypothetical protein
MTLVVGAAVTQKPGQTWAAAIGEFETLTGRPLPIRRCYDSGVPSSISSSKMQHDIGKRASIWSFKPTISTPLATLETLATSIVTSGHPVDVIVYHEPVDNMPGPDFVSLYRRTCAPFREAGIPIGVCYTNYSCNLPYADPKCALPMFWPGEDVVDFLAIDEYPVGEIAAGKDALPMDARVRRVAQFADARGVPLGVAEYGVAGEWDVVKSARWMRSVADWAVLRATEGRPLRWLNYFSSDVGGNYWLANRTEYVDAYVEACKVLEV